MPLLRSVSRRFPLASLCLLLAVMGACGLSYEWRSVEKDAPFEDLWMEVVRLARLHGFPVNHAETDRGRKIYVSVWREYPAPFHFGRRSRFKARFLRQGDGSGWRIEFFIQKQIIENIARGFHVLDEDWTDAGQDIDREGVLLGQLRLFRSKSMSVREGGPGLAIVNRPFPWLQERHR